MKNLPLSVKTIALLCCLLISALVQAQTIHTIDIEKATSSVPHNNTYTTLDMFAELNGIFYFAADDGIHGTELWRSNGTSAGTWMVKDINIGVAASSPDDIVVSGNKLFFTADDGVHGRELWVSDGTAANTFMVLDIGYYAGNGANPNYLTDINGVLYFVVDVFEPGSQIWKSDGTAGGTMLVADLNNSFPFGNNARFLSNVNGKIYFVVNSFDSNPQLYVTDGTQAGTQLVQQTNIFGNDNVSNLTPLNSKLFFAADDGNGERLWMTDGITTAPVNDSNNISLPYIVDKNARPFIIKNNTLFFQGYTAAKGNELCKFVTTNVNANVQFVKDIVPGTGSSNPSNIANVNGTIFFSTNPSNGGDATLWKSDGTSVGTTMVKDINPGGTNGFYGFVNMNGTLVFAYNNDALGFELWKSDGTDAGTQLVKDIMPGLYSSYPQWITYKSNALIMGAYNEQYGTELWTSNGTEGGTVLIKDINRSATASSNPFGFISSATNSNKGLFTAFSQKYGWELWQSNGFAGGTRLVKDITLGTGNSYPTHYVNLKNNSYFVAYTDAGTYLGKTDGTAAGTNLFYQLNIPYGYVQDVAASDDLLYFTVFNFNNNLQELWRSDGTASGTGIIKGDISPFYNSTPVGAGHYLFFVNYDFNYGAELWKSDGTAAGTTIVKDIYPGFQGSNPFDLYNFNNRLYFAADYGYGPFLYTSDGTEAGTKLVKAAVVQFNTPFAQAGNKLFFDAYSTIANGYELYATNGTPAGTKLVRDINSGPASSNPFRLVDGDNLLYFMADDGKHGQELWASDGVKAGTHLVKNITPGIDNTILNYMVNVDDELFFTLNDTLWQSDATNDGTHKIQDPALDSVTGLWGFTRIGNWLYFSGYKPSIGYELYTARATDFQTVDNLITQQKAIAPAAINAFEVKLLTNPVANQLKIAINAKEQQAAQVTIMDALGRVIQSASQTIPAGTTILTYNAGNWAGGMYLVKLTNAGGVSVTMKAVK